MALTLPADGKVVGCDMTDEYLKAVNAQQYFREVNNKNNNLYLHSDSPFHKYPSVN